MVGKKQVTRRTQKAARVRARRNTEIWTGVAASALVISIFLASSIDRYVIGTSQYASVVAAVLVDLANNDRAALSLGALTVDPKLVAAAQAKADDMAAKGYFAHVSPDGVDPWHWFAQANYAFDYAGENLAVDFSDSTGVNAAWMNSPTHRENILNPHFTQIGIAVAEGVYEGRRTIFVVQEFGAPATRAASAIAKPARTNVPESPTVPAVASALPVSDETTLANAHTPAVAGAQSAPPVAALPGRPDADRTPLAEKDGWYAPWWQHALASPGSAMRMSYAAIGILVLMVLAFATGFEVHVRHRKKAVAAGFVLALMSVLFVLGDTFVFTDPSITPSAAQTASAAAAL